MGNEFDLFEGLAGNPEDYIYDGKLRPDNPRGGPQRTAPQPPTFDAYLAKLQDELDSYGDLVELSPEWEASMQTLNNYLAFNEIDWNDVHPRDIATAYIAVIRGGIPDAEEFLDQAEHALAGYQLQKVLPVKLLAELDQVANPKNRMLCAYCNRTPWQPFLDRLRDAMEHPYTGPLYNFQAPDAQYNPDPNVEYKRGDTTPIKKSASDQQRVAGALSNAEWAWYLAHPVFDADGNNIEFMTRMNVLNSFAQAGPAATLTGIIGTLCGDDAAQLQALMQAASMLDTHAGGMAGYSPRNPGFKRSSSGIRGRRRPTPLNSAARQNRVRGAAGTRVIRRPFVPPAVKQVVHPQEVKTGIAREHVAPMTRVIGKRLQGSVLEKVWNDAYRTGDYHRLTLENSREIFDAHRTRFWRAVRKNPAAMKLFTDAGFVFEMEVDKNGNAPYYELKRGKTTLQGNRRILASIDHITQRQEAPRRAVSADNLQVTFLQENTGPLNILYNHDPFSVNKPGTVINAPRGYVPPPGFTKAR